MKFSIITPNRNGDRFLEESIQSILAQRKEGVDLEYILIDGGSTDGSLDIANRYSPQISCFISEKDSGPTHAINKGFRLATGDIIAWLNSDDRYHPGVFRRVEEAFKSHPEKTMCFGRCRIVDEQGRVIRRWITRFKESFFPLSSWFAIQCLNFVSQPTLFFTRHALKGVGPLREDLLAAWDYEFILRLWKHGGAICLKEPEPIADFRWHENSISGSNYPIQFKEEYNAARAQAGQFAPQTLIHGLVRYGVVSVYSMMERFNSGKHTTTA